MVTRNQTLINSLFTNNTNTGCQEQSIMPSDNADYLLMPNFLDTLPKFDSHGSTQAAEDWLAVIEGVAELHRWSDTFQIETACSRMTGPANNWFSGRKFRTWNEFVCQIKHTFVGTKLDEVHAKWAQGEFKAIADYFQYFHYKAGLCWELELPFNEVKKQIIAGLRFKVTRTMSLLIGTTPYWRRQSVLWYNDVCSDQWRTLSVFQKKKVYVSWGHET